MEGLTYRRLVALVRRHWWVVLQAVVVFAVAAGYYTYQLPPKPYQTTASLLVYPATADTGAGTVNLNGFYSSQVRILESDQTAARAAEAVPGTSAADIKAILRVTLDSSSGTVFITATSEDATRAVQVANAVASAYVDERDQSRLSELKSRAATIDEQVAQTTRDLDEVNAEIARVSADGDDTGTLEAQRDVLLGRYQTLFDQQQTILTQLASQPGLTELLEAAVVAERPPNPNVALRAALGAAMGMLVGFALAALREAADTKLRSTDAAEVAMGLTALTEIPRAKKTKKRTQGAGVIHVVDDPHGAYAESVRSLCTTIRFVSAEQPISSLVVTSPQSGDGKSMVAANLAAEWAMAGFNTILVSGDLRQPTVDAAFECASRAGLSDLLAKDVGHASAEGSSTAQQKSVSGENPGTDENSDTDEKPQPSATHAAAAPVTGAHGEWGTPSTRMIVQTPPGTPLETQENWEDWENWENWEADTGSTVTGSLCPTRLPLLQILPAGGRRANPVELLSSGRLLEVLRELREVSDMVIIDSPPTVVAEAMILAKAADATIVVVSPRSTTKRLARLCADRLATIEVRVIGLVVNRAGSERSSPYGYYSSEV